METEISSPALVSVVLPVHNEAKWLKECVGSLLAQTHSSIEIIIVDDGSADGSFAIAEELRAKHPSSVRTARFEAVRGEGAVRTEGMHMARGAYIIETDADAAFPEDFVARTLAYMKESDAECASLGELKVHQKRTGILADYWRAKRRASYLLRSSGKKGAVVGIYCFSRKVADTLGHYDSSVPSGTDFDFAMRAQKAGFAPVWAEDVHFYHADETDWLRFYKRLYNGSRLSMPVQKRWGMWLSAKRQAFEVIHALGAVALIALAIALARFYPGFALLSLLVLFMIDGLLASLLHGETRLIWKQLISEHKKEAAVMLPLITFLRVRAANFGKVSAILFPRSAYKKTTFDV